MPSEIYRTRQDGSLVWNWELGFGNEPRIEDIESHFSFVEMGVWGVDMTFKKKIKKKIEIPCAFCGKDIKDRIYITKKNGITFKTCSGCKFVFKILYEETKAGKDKAIYRMLVFCKENPRHCTLCTRFKPRQTDLCDRGFHTGIGMHETSFPESYANHGCSSFDRITPL